jgi:signal transduction histidine kinase/CheY-like chemotaxis protein
MSRQRTIVGHISLSLGFLVSFVLLNRPEVLLFSKLGSVVWYPPIGVAFALLLGISPWYGIALAIADSLAGSLIYRQALTYSQTVGALCVAVVYSGAAYLLRSVLRIDPALRRQRDVVQYVLVTSVAAIVSTAGGVLFLIADHEIRWVEFWRAAPEWFLGDEVGLLGVAPFLLIHVAPRIRKQLFPSEPAASQAVDFQDATKLWAPFESLMQLTSILILLWVMFGLTSGQLLSPIFIPVTWVALRKGIRGVASCLLILNFGMVAALRMYPPPPGLPKTAILMFVVSAVGLILGSSFSERKTTAAELLARTAELTQANRELVLAKAKAEDASRIKSDFLANMSHEIRTPINGILGMTELVMNTTITPEQREYLRLLKSSGDSLLSVINGILDFSKVESGKLELAAVRFNLPNVVSDTVKALAAWAHEKDLELICDIGPSVPEELVGDSGRLRQVLTNLVGNAIKFTQRGEIVVEVGQGSSSNGDVLLHFRVSDTGIGIPREKHAYIFEAFTQADSSTTREYGGTGLGLAICSRLVKLMGGQMWLQSEVNRGSVFHFTAHFQTAPDPISPRYPAELSEIPVLLVDDNCSSRRLLAKTTAQWGMQPISVENGESALDVLRATENGAAEIRVAIVDTDMPGMDGFELARQIKASECRTCKLIMMLTSPVNLPDQERSAELGIAGCILKPIHKPDLMKALTHAVAGTASEIEQRGTLEDPTCPGIPILLVEDNPVNQKVVARMLEKLGHTVTIVQNGREALSIVQSQKFELIFMDLQMPEMDGLTATQQIREREKQTGAHIPIIAMTAHAMQTDRQRCLDGGMDGYLEKPVTSQSLERKILLTLDCRPNVEEDRRDIETPVSGWSYRRALLRTGDDEDLLWELIEIFLQECPAKLTELQRGIESRQAKLVENAAHALKGELSCLDLPELAAIARRLEMMGQDRKLEQASSVFLMLKTGISRVLEQMQQALSKHQDAPAL